MRIDYLLEIVDTCLKMDEKAIAIYHNLSSTAENKELEKFWEHMSQEEAQHVVCWKNLSDLVREGIIPLIFEKPEDVLNELKNNYDKILEILGQSLNKVTTPEGFILAFRLEFYLLHPAFEQLWHFYGIVQDGEYNPEIEYENHIHEFILTMRKFGASTIELEALGETVERLWIQNKSIVQEANIDYLTKIFNRRGFFNAVTSLAYLSKRNKFITAVLLIDIDFFKRINDTYGHQKGDAVLEKVATILKSNIRSSDIVGRFGGEEFVIFLPQIEKNNLYYFSEKIRLAVHEGTKKNVAVTVSIGAYAKQIYEEVGSEIQEMIKNADKYLYEAKRKGRNQVIC